MELGLLYEFEAPQPWAGDHPWGQRTAERAAYKKAIEQIVLADQKCFHTSWLVEHHFREGRSHMPCSEAVLGALGVAVIAVLALRAMGEWKTIQAREAEAQRARNDSRRKPSAG